MTENQRTQNCVTWVTKLLQHNIKIPLVLGKPFSSFKSNYFFRNSILKVTWPKKCISSCHLSQALKIAPISPLIFFCVDFFSIIALVWYKGKEYHKRFFWTFKKWLNQAFMSQKFFKCYMSHSGMAIQPVQMNIYQSNICRKDFSWLHLNDEPRVPETQQEKDQQFYVSVSVTYITYPSSN